MSADLEAEPRTFQVVPVTSHLSRLWWTDVPVPGPTADGDGAGPPADGRGGEALTGVEYANVAQMRELLVDLLDLAV